LIINRCSAPSPFKKKMNRSNDKHFFDCWDLARKIEDRLPFARAKERYELLELEEQLYEDSGFYANYTYQEAIAAYREHNDYKKEI